MIWSKFFDVKANFYFKSKSAYFLWGKQGSFSKSKFGNLTKGFESKLLAQISNKTFKPHRMTNIWTVEISIIDS